MRKLIKSSLVALVLSVGVPAAAHAQCLLCGVVGFAIGSASGSQYGGSSGAVIYVAPRISERIANPLEVRMAAYATHDYSSASYKGQTIQQIFDKTVEKSSGYTILEVVRVFYPSSPDLATFWFAYIEKDKVKSLALLPPPTN